MDDDLLDDLVRITRRTERAARALRGPQLEEIRARIREGVTAADRAASGSWLGYHSRIYIDEMQAREPEERFNPLTRRLARFGRGPDRWKTYDAHTVRQMILGIRGVTAAEEAQLEDAARRAHESFEDAKTELLPTLDAVLADRADSAIERVRDEIREIQSHVSADTLVSQQTPAMITVQDAEALAGGICAPVHVEIEAKLLAQESHATALDVLTGHARYLRTYLEKSLKLKGRSLARTQGKVFVGHGQSLAWRELASFLQDRLALKWDEFNREPAAGLTTSERLSAMLDDAVFAFLVMTGEDEHADGLVQTRLNLVHEVGLFQGRLGFQRAIVLLEDGCEEPSNIRGLTQLRFRKGELALIFEDVRRVLEREKII